MVICTGVAGLTTLVCDSSGGVVCRGSRVQVLCCSEGVDVCCTAASTPAQVYMVR